jgi:hypothetical protein
LFDFFNTDEIYFDENNKYFQNASLIKETFHDLIEDEAFDSEEEIGFDINKFCDYLFSSVYFVVIETYAGLSKTLQIFNAINTTGLDLNGGDLFKIRMYEYLTNNKNEDESAFERIREVYQLIDERNKQAGKQIVNIYGVLETYKDILIAKYELPNPLFQFGWETFYDRLFDTLLGVKNWEHFGKVLENPDFDIKLDEIKWVVDIRFEWNNYKHISVESMFAYELIGRSRYSRYLKIIYLFLYKYKDETLEDKHFKLSELLVVLNKLFFVFSIIFAKSVYEMHNFMYSIQRSLINKDIADVMTLLYDKLNVVRDRNTNNKVIENALNGYITDNSRRKNLICWISAYLDEIVISDDIKKVEEKLFKTQFDIEHIHANADRDGSIKIEEGLQNSIGNLVMLEAGINRSLKEAPFLKQKWSIRSKKEEYKKSKYASVQKISDSADWNVQEIEERREKEVSAIIRYLFHK